RAAAGKTGMPARRDTRKNAADGTHGTPAGRGNRAKRAAGRNDQHRTHRPGIIRYTGVYQPRDKE
ncbi:MAG TPA: hypothetical protein PK846_19530, partial [Spirochaetota bacterium]|nr:hypothetical protein [Spirochaetota bacterium]